MSDEESVDVTAVDEQVNDAANPETDKTAAEPSEPTGSTETPKPGTPDKALQKMQQELGNATRELAALKQQLSDGELSAAQLARVAKAEQRLTKIREFTGRPDKNDGFESVDPVAEQVLDLTEKAGEIDKVAAENRRLNDRLAKLEDDRNWEVARANFKGLDVDAIWKKAVTDSIDVLGDGVSQQAVNRLASKTFHDRCTAAMKRQKDDAEPSKKGAAPGGSPSQYKVGSGQRAAPVLSEDEETLAMARMLVVEK